MVSPSASGAAPEAAPASVNSALRTLPAAKIRARWPAGERSWISACIGTL
jgi:hypothetical protein